jgi:hypothetical protein
LKGQIVVDDKKLEDYNIKDGDLMVLMLVKVKHKKIQPFTLK